LEAKDRSYKLQTVIGGSCSWASTEATDSPENSEKSLQKVCKGIFFKALQLVGPVHIGALKENDK
jgi:hypothetical protein